MPTPVAMATNFGTKLIDYNWALALFAPTPYFRARAFRRCHLNFSPADPRFHGNKFWFPPTPYFRARAIRWCHLNLSHDDPCCHGNQSFLFKDKISCSRNCYITHNFFLAPTSLTCPEIFWKQ